MRVFTSTKMRFDLKQSSSEKINGMMVIKENKQIWVGGTFIFKRSKRGTIAIKRKKNVSKRQGKRLWSIDRQICLHTRPPLSLS